MFLMVMLFSLCVNANMTPSVNGSRNWELVFEDNFEGTELDKTKWSHVSEDAPRRDGRWRSDGIELDGQGNLIVKTFYDSQKNVYVSGAIRSKDKFQFKYGYVEAKVTLAKEEGHWPAIWLWPGSIDQSLEIDIFEQPKRNKHIQHALHWYQDKKVIKHWHRSKDIKLPKSADDTYVFGVWWKPAEVVFYVNGEETWRKFVQVKYMKETYLKITDEIGKWAGKIEKAKLPDQWSVDYIKVYKLK